MTGYTPITGMVRARYCDSTVRGGYADAQLLSVTPEEHEKNHAEFDRWLAGEIRKAKAEALTEAANHLSLEGVLWHGDSGVTVREGWNDQPLTNWLRDRAQQLTEES